MEKSVFFMMAVLMVFRAVPAIGEPIAPLDP